MARVLVNGEWYDEIMGASLYELEYQRIVLSRATTLFPAYRAVSFDKIVCTDDGRSSRPDFALVDRKYREWWVVEVEMDTHDFGRHVLPQVRALSEGSYGLDVADWLCRGRSRLSRTSVVDMLKGEPPRVLVIVNRAQPAWAEELSRFGAMVSVVEVFRSKMNRLLLRVNGEQPMRPADIVSYCRPDRVFPTLLYVESPAGLGVRRGGLIRLLFEGMVTEWQRHDAKDGVWLGPVSKSPLKRAERYAIVRRDDGSMEIERDTRGRRHH